MAVQRLVLPAAAAIGAPLSVVRVWRLLLAGLLFHCVYLLSIFDIYFRSPLVTGLRAVAPVQPAPARRLVLFVGDGLRADKCWEHDEHGAPRAPFLQRMARTRGAWGVSHTRVPTESRPGHVAMIAGFYEDVSAVTKGWKRNPVAFDHLLLRARHAWSFGAPEILDLFPGPNVVSKHYPESMIDFAKDALDLDRWSLLHLHELFAAAAVDAALDRKLRSDQVVIFVHLLGLDTNGHAFGPHSKEYLDNVAFVDAGIERAVQAIDAYYADGRTAYVFTSDHGMSDAGTHGDGDPDNTRCPLMLWGAGVAAPAAAPAAPRDAYTRNWHLDDVLRRDIEQAALTPLMATLVGIPIPTNSEGVLPLEYLDASDEFKVRAALANLEQIFASLEAKETLRARQEPLFVPYTATSAHINTLLAQAADLIGSHRLPPALDLITATRATVFAGLQYYQKYDWLMLRTVVALGYVGWILYATLYLVAHSAQSEWQSGPEGTESKQTTKNSTSTKQKSPKRPSSLPLKLLFASASLGSTVYLAAKSAPLQFHAYFYFALWFWHAAAQLLHTHGARALASAMGLARRAPAMALYLLGLEVLVASFFHQAILSLLVPVLGLGTVVAMRGAGAAWRATIWLLFVAASVFPALGPIKNASQPLLYAGILLIVAFALLVVSLAQQRQCSLPLTAGRLGVVLLSAFLVHNSDRLFQAKLGLPIANQAAGWAVVAYSVASPLLFQSATSTPLARLFDLFLALAPTYILLSISYETIFYVFFAAPLVLWVMHQERGAGETGKEGKTSKTGGAIVPDHRPTDPLMLFLGYKLLVCVLLAFFGTGNFASISSFTLPSVYRLVTLFSPFLMAALLVGKILIPVCFLAAAFGALVRTLHASPIAIFLLVIATSDVMTLNFFFLVRDYGSWLEIGTSISHFIISSVFSVIALLLLGLSQTLLSGVRFPPPAAKGAKAE